MEIKKISTNSIKVKKEKIESTSFIKKLKSKVEIATLGPILGLLTVIIIFSIIAPNFFTFENIPNILRQVSVIGVMAIGITFVIIIGEIDLSIASTMAIGGLVAGALSIGGYGLGFELPVVLSIAGALLVGTMFGVISGLANAKLKIPSFIATIAMMYIIDGLALWFSGSQPLYGLPASLEWFGSGKLFGLPVIVLVFAVVFIISHIVLSKTPFGRNLYAIGGNEEAARMSGISVDRHKITALAISGFLSALAGVMMLGRIGSAQVTVGASLMLPPIAGVILGGTSLFGGVGSMWRTLVGVLLMGVLVNGLNLLGVGTDGQNLATGIVLFVALALNVIDSKK